MFFNITLFKYIFKKFFSRGYRNTSRNRTQKTKNMHVQKCGRWSILVMHFTCQFRKKKKKKRFLFTKNFRVSAITPFSWKSFSEIFPQMSRNFFRKCILIPSYIHGQITQHNLNKRDISKFNFPTLHFLNGKYFPLDPFMHS